MKNKSRKLARAFLEIRNRLPDVTTNEKEFQDALTVIGFEQGIKCRVSNMELEGQLKEAREQRDAALRASFRAETWLRMLHKVSGNVMTKHDAAELLADIRQCEDLRAWEFEAGKMPRFQP